MLDRIRKVIAEHGRLPVSSQSLSTGQDLYASGLTSFAGVQVMLALEEAFDVEFPDYLLKRSSFASIDAIAACLRELGPSASVSDCSTA